MNAPLDTARTLRAAASDPAQLDFLGRMPIPLRRPFKAGLDRAAAAHHAAGGPHLDYCFLSGAEWYRPFDGLAAADDPAQLPGMLVTTFYHDIVDARLLAHYAPGPASRQPACHPIVEAGGLVDPEGVFRLFSVIPFVFLVDEKRLAGRPAPRVWADLFEPMWENDIVFGGWRPNDHVPYQDFNAFLLRSLYREYGAPALRAFSTNVRGLQHNIRIATQTGSNSRQVGAVAVLPWLQAELCPRRERTRVVWPEDGALTMPIGYLVQAAHEERLAPLVDYVNGCELGAVLARNCYPPTNPAVTGAFPEGARCKWPGWDYARSHDMAAEGRSAAEIFFAGRHEELRACS
jgi:ABC-type Fe3+ transport system substrate-binding protein